MHEGGRLLAPDAAMDFNCALDLTLLNLSRVKVILVSRDAEDTQAQRMGFLYASTLEAAFSLVETEGKRTTVHILPSGGVIVPVRG